MPRAQTRQDRRDSPSIRDADVRDAGGHGGRRRHRRHRWLRVTAWILGVIIILGAAAAGGAYAQLRRPVPQRSLSVDALAAFQAPPASFAWPSDDRESAVAVLGLPGSWSRSGQVEYPIASVAKIMTAYLVLRDHPLATGAGGPSITVSAADAATYQADKSRGDSVAAVAAGEVLTERQALEALMLPSADNIAMLLAAWDAGSVSAFKARMNAEARALGMSHTDYTDPSGLDATTVSTARDQLILVGKALAIPAFAAIVALPSATLPAGTGTIANYNIRTGTDGIIGVKTGSDSAAGACWAFAVRRAIGGTSRIVYGVVLGATYAPSSSFAVSAAVNDGVALADSVPHAFRTVTVLPAGSEVGRILVPWSSVPVPVVTARAITGLAAPGARVALIESAAAPAARSFATGTVVGSLSAGGLLNATSTPLVTAAPSYGPPLSWRLLRW